MVVQPILFRYFTCILLVSILWWFDTVLFASRKPNKGRTMEAADSHKVESTKWDERAEAKKNHDLDAVGLYRSVHGSENTVALSASLSLLV